MSQTLSKYQIGNFEDNALLGARYLTTQEHIEFKQSHSFILNCKQVISLYNIVVRNYNELIDYDDKLNVVMSRADFNEIKSYTRDVHLEINRLLLNYLSSVRLYVDYLRAIFSRSEILKPFSIKYKDILSKCYDQSFAYRFLYKLRNYSQHIDLPIENIKLKTNRISRGNYTYSIPIYFNTEVLLKKYNEWGIVKKDFETLPKDLIALLVVEEHFSSIKYIYEEVNILIRNAALPYTSFLNNLTREYRNEFKGLCIFKSIPIYENTKLTGENLKMQPIDLGLLDYYTMKSTTDEKKGKEGVDFPL